MITHCRGNLRALQTHSDSQDDSGCEKLLPRPSESAAKRCEETENGGGKDSPSATQVIIDRI